MTKIIGVDFDDVLMAFNESFCVWHNANYGTSYTKKDFFTYEFDRVLKCSLDEAVMRCRQFINSQEHSVALPVEGSMKGLNLLREKNIHIITARANIVSTPTIQWVERHFPEMARRVHFLGKDEGFSHNEIVKAEKCKELGIEIFVDDSLVHATGVSEAGIPVLLFDSPWNQTNVLPPNIERVFSWDEIVKKLQG